MPFFGKRDRLWIRCAIESPLQISNLKAHKKGVRNGLNKKMVLRFIFYYETKLKNQS